MKEGTIKNFKSLYDQIIEKIDQISSLASARLLYEQGEDFQGIEIDEGNIIHRSETYISGCGTDSFITEIALEDITKPLGFFEDKIAAKITQNAQRDKRIKEDNKKKREEADLKEYERLKNKFKNLKTS